MDKITAVNIVLFNGDRILSVSRKDDHTDFNLPGGKVDETDMCPVSAIIREVKEETGLTITNIRKVMETKRNGYLVATYLADWSGDIQTDEPHIVKWADPIEIVKGKFGYYNDKLFDYLGIKY